VRTESDGELDAFGRWLADRRLTQERRVRFYGGWVRRLLRLRAARPREAREDSLRVFLDDLAESGTLDWQVRQAAEVVTVYCGQFRVPQNTPVCGTGDAGAGLAKPAEALEHMQRLCGRRCGCVRPYCRNAAGAHRWSRSRPCSQVAGRS
jgi:hypothetical protein